MTKVVLTVDDKGLFYIDRGQVAYNEILPALEAKVAENPKVVIVINCDKNQQVEQFQYALNIAQQANPSALMIATTDKNASQ